MSKTCEQSLRLHYIIHELERSLGIRKCPEVPVALVRHITSKPIEFYFPVGQSRLMVSNENLIRILELINSVTIRFKVISIDEFTR